MTGTEVLQALGHGDTLIIDLVFCGLVILCRRSGLRSLVPRVAISV